MSGDVEGEAPRLRPLSGGIWTLFSWLRRSERSSSDESISSVGSDRTAVSFDFLGPLHYKHANSPLVLQQSPLTDTYKKRLHERNLRRQHDRDLTLRRKYGLYTEDGLGYDAFSLPPARKIPKDSAQGRQRRATSESIIQPRAAYVPGKRRAPLPPTRVISSTLPRNYKRKRPAPKPPVKYIENNKENITISAQIQMNSNSILDNQFSNENNKISDGKIEKDARKGHPSKEVKLRTEKNFLKQIFDNKKRNSSIDTSYIKVLPNISELDKQAAEIIEANKSLHSGYKTITEGNWMCTNCLKRYNSTITSCIYCSSSKSHNKKNNDKSVSTTVTNIFTQTESKILDSNKNIEKEKLKMMLKEMKDSLPKRSNKNEKGFVYDKHNITPTEMPTLRIGSTIKETVNVITDQNLNNIQSDSKLKIRNAKDSFLTPQPSSSKQLPSATKKSEAKITNGEKLNETKTCNKLIIPQPSCSSSLKDVPTKQSNVVVNKHFDLNLLNVSKQLKSYATEEIELNLKSNPLNVDKNNTSTSVHCVKSPIDNKLSQSSKEQTTVSNENISSRPKIISNTPTFLDTKDVVETRGIIQSNNIQINSNDTKEKSNNYKITQNIKPLGNKSMEAIKIVNEKSNFVAKKKIENLILPKVATQKVECVTNESSKVDNNNLHTPLKISSLLNPLYCPKYSDMKDKNKLTEMNSTKLALKQEDGVDENKSTLISSVPKLPSSSTSLSSSKTSFLKNNLPKTGEKFEDIKPKDVSQNIKSAEKIGDKNLDHHAHRRDLINQLEQSIAKGDEKTAAEAAAKLAKFKLACSVLSFSSQIISRPLRSQSKVENLNSNITTNNVESTNEPNEQPKSIVTKNLKETLIAPGTSNLASKVIGNEKKSAEVVNRPVASTSKDLPEQIIPIDVWIEDKEATRGPIRLLVSRKAIVGELKRQAEKSLGLQICLQRWIIGKTLCSNDNIPLISLAGPELAAPFYLCLVESDPNKENVSQKQNDLKSKDIIEVKNKNPSDVYTELMKLEQQALVPNSEKFECGVCIEQCAEGDGVVLRECIHTFCRECLADVVRHCTEPVVNCPAIACPGALQEREIRALLSPEDYEKWLARSLAAAESGTRNTFHCRTRDCTGWAFCEPGVRRFPCPVCKQTNCLPCQAVHDGETCEQYRTKLREAVTAVETDQTDAGTQALLKSLIDRGEALECPECKAIITKKWGCDWIKCSACKTEICWVTKGRRWGPGGKGDTSAGCRCGVDGKRCHPLCGYCH